MKATTESSGIESTRRGLFRRGRRSAGTREEFADQHETDHVAAVNDLARRLDELAGLEAITDATEHHTRPAFDLQRAAIARANTTAAADLGTVTADATPQHVQQTTPAPVPTAATPETPMQPISPDDADLSMLDDADIEARLDAALQSVKLEPSMPAPVQETETSPGQVPAALAPTAPIAIPAPAVAPAAVLAPTQPSVVAASGAGFIATEGASAAAAIGIDVDRVVRLIEDEAVAVQRRLEIEVTSATLQAAEIVDRAEGEAERIREHGQTQARVLLGEVEEIISEAQQTGEQILLRSNEEASSLRKDAAAVLHQAQTEARAIVETSRREGEQVLAEQRRLATVRAQEAMREQDRLKDQIRRLEERRRQVLESLEPLISQLTQMMPAQVEQNVVQLQRQKQQ